MLQHLLVQLGLGEELLQPDVLAFEFFEPLGVVSLHPAVLRESACPRRFGDPELAADLLDVRAASQQLVAIGEFADDLLGRVPSSRHLWVLSCIRHDDGRDQTAQPLDHYKGLRSVTRNSWEHEDRTDLDQLDRNHQISSTETIERTLTRARESGTEYDVGIEP